MIYILFHYDLDYSLQIGEGVLSKPHSPNQQQTQSMYRPSLGRVPSKSWGITD